MASTRLIYDDCAIDKLTIESMRPLMFALDERIHHNNHETSITSGSGPRSDRVGTSGDYGFLPWGTRADVESNLKNLMTPNNICSSPYYCNSVQCKNAHLPINNVPAMQEYNAFLTPLNVRMDNPPQNLMGNPYQNQFQYEWPIINPAQFVQFNDRIGMVSRLQIKDNYVDRKKPKYIPNKNSGSYNYRKDM